jgi:ATP adenylyltransferase
MSYRAPPMNPPLWAPWRMEYILGKKSAECVFCGMVDARFGAPAPDQGSAEVKSRAPASEQNHVLAVLPDAFICLNRYPFAAGHLLVAPRRHLADVLDMGDAEYSSLMRVLKETAVRLRRAVRCEGMNVGFNLGAAAGAGIADHAHAHVVPRWNGDTNFMPVLADVRVMPQHLDDTYRHLVPFFADLPSLFESRP